MPTTNDAACSVCGERKNESAFYAGSAMCKDCKVARRQQASNKNQNKYLGRLRTEAKRHARRRAIEFDLKAGHLEELWRKQVGRCALSGAIMTHHRDGQGHKDCNASIDRINSALGYVAGNVQLTCLRANLMRSTLTLTEFNWWIRTISDHLTAR